MVDFDDLSNFGNAAGFYQRKAALEQQEETNQLLRQQQAEQDRINRLPKCLECAGDLPKVGVGTCMHCGFKMSWVGSTPCVPGTEKQTTVLLEKEAERKRRAGLKTAKLFGQEKAIKEALNAREEALNAKKGQWSLGIISLIFSLLGFWLIFFLPYSPSEKLLGAYLGGACIWLAVMCGIGALHLAKKYWNWKISEQSNKKNNEGSVPPFRQYESKAAEGETDKKQSAVNLAVDDLEPHPNNDGTEKYFNEGFFLHDPPEEQSKRVENESTSSTRSAGKIKVPCPGCKKVLNCPVQMAGKAGKCPHCSAKFKIPIPKTV